jgi:prevent-host-death family protein
LYRRYVMVKVAVSEVRKDLAETLNRVRYEGSRVVLHRRGKNIAAIVPVEDLELLEELEDRIDIKEARKALKESKKKGNVRWQALKDELGL